MAATIVRSLSLSLCHTFARSIQPGGDYCALDNSFWLLNYIFHLSLIFFSLFQFTRCVFLPVDFYFCVYFFSFDWFCVNCFFCVYAVLIQFFFLSISVLLSHHKWACRWELSSLYAWIERQRETFDFVCRAARVLSHPMWLVGCLTATRTTLYLLWAKEKKTVCVNANIKTPRRNDWNKCLFCAILLMHFNKNKQRKQRKRKKTDPSSLTPAQKHKCTLCAHTRRSFIESSNVHRSKIHHKPIYFFQHYSIWVCRRTEHRATKINDTSERRDIGDFTTYFVVCLCSLLISSIVVDSIFNCVLTLFFLVCGCRTWWVSRRFLFPFSIATGFFLSLV